jgi:hypothetical protein
MPLPRCPRCGSAPITIMFGVYPLVFCSGCGARWTQAGGDQQAIKQVQEPAVFASARYPVAGDQHAGSATAPRAHRNTGRQFSERTLPW